MDDWRNIVGSVAPKIATALGGPLAGLAVQAIAGVFGLGEGATKEDVAKAVANATPEQLLALKKADHDFAVRMRELDIDLEDIAARDRDSARLRESTVRDWMPGILAVLVTAGFFGALGYLLVAGKPQHGGDALLVMLGALGTSFAAVIAYYFGSSAGSKAKTDGMLVAMRPAH